MSLVKCPECQSEVSDRASSCPKCGFPLKESAVSSKEKIVTVNKAENIELTSKKWKIMKLVFWPMFIIGLILFFNGFMVMMIEKENESGVIKFAIGSLMSFVGFIGLIVSKFGSWWQHR